MSNEHNQQQPAAAQEAVAWFTDDHLSDKSATTYDPSVAERWRKKGWPVTALYAAPVTAAPAEFDRARETPRRQRAVEMLLSMGYQWQGGEWIAASTPAAPWIDHAIFARDIHHAIADAGLAPMSPADNYTLREVIRSVIDASPKGGSEARDAARLDWLDTHSFTAYRQYDPIIGLAGHCVVVHETVTPRRGNVHDTIRGAIDAAMRARAGDAEVQP